MPRAKIRCSRAVLGFEWLTDGVLHVAAAGELANDSGPVLTSTLDGLLSAPREQITICWDLSALRRWEPGSRRATMMLLLRHQRRIVEQHMLATSPVIHMDIRVLGVVLGNVSCYDERALFEFAVDAAVGAEQRECA